MRPTPSPRSSKLHDTFYSPAGQTLEPVLRIGKAFLPRCSIPTLPRGWPGVPWHSLPPIMAYFRQRSMFEVVFLGTAAAVPSAEPGSPALLVPRGPARFLVDYGTGPSAR